MEIRRYAVYYAPPAGDFADRAASWLGWDAVLGKSLDHPELGLGAQAITTEPRRYGFHGTIKPPFRLAEGVTFEDVTQALADLCAKRAPLRFEGLRLHHLDGFLALTLQGDDAPLQSLAAEVVRGLDRLRAPLSPAEIARRRPERLSPRQRALLDLYGYPFVMEEFRFHLTLTDRLGPQEAARAAQVLQEYFTPVLPRPFEIGDLCLFGEDGASGQFHLLHRYALGG